MKHNILRWLLPRPTENQVLEQGHQKQKDFFLVGDGCVEADIARGIIASYNKYAKSPEGYPHEEAWRHVHEETVGGVKDIYLQVSDDWSIKTDVGTFHEDDDRCLVDSITSGCKVYWIWGRWYYGWRQSCGRRAPDTEEATGWKRLIGVRLPCGQDPYVIWAAQNAKYENRLRISQSDGLD